MSLEKILGRFARASDKDEKAAAEELRDEDDLLFPVKEKLKDYGRQAGKSLETHFVGSAARHPAKTFAARAAIEAGKSAIKEQPLSAATALYAVVRGKSVLMTTATSGLAAWIERDPEAIQKISKGLTSGALKLTGHASDFILNQTSGGAARNNSDYDVVIDEDDVIEVVSKKDKNTPNP